MLLSGGRVVQTLPTYFVLPYLVPQKAFRPLRFEKPGEELRGMAATIRHWLRQEAVFFRIAAVSVLIANWIADILQYWVYDDLERNKLHHHVWSGGDFPHQWTFSGPPTPETYFNYLLDNLRSLLVACAIGFLVPARYSVTSRIGACAFIALFIHWDVWLSFYPWRTYGGGLMSNLSVVLGKALAPYVALLLVAGLILVASSVSFGISAPLRVSVFGCVVSPRHMGGEDRFLRLPMVKLPVRAATFWLAIAALCALRAIPSLPPPPSMKSPPGLPPPPFLGGECSDEHCTSEGDDCCASFLCDTVETATCSGGMVPVRPHHLCFQKVTGFAGYMCTPAVLSRTPMYSNVLYSACEWDHRNL